MPDDLFEDLPEGFVFSPALDDYDFLEPIPPPPPPPPERSRQAQDEALRRHGFPTEEIRRPPIDGHDDLNEQGFVMPTEEDELRNER